MNIDNIKLLDVIDRNMLQSLQDAFAKATGMAALATDEDGPVTELSNATDFCIKYTRNSPVGCERCNKCDLDGGKEANRTGRPSVYYCHAGLVDFAAPIILNGKHIGSLIGGQVLTEAPDEEKFRRIAAEIGVNPDDYIAALRKVKIVPKEQVDAAANLLYQMANALSEAGYQKLIALEGKNNSAARLSELNAKQSELDNQIDNIMSEINYLKKLFDEVKTSALDSEKSINSTDSIVKSIETASTQLTLISFNASIEAKRAGAAGAGFNVIAQEVRTLADTNTKQAGEVEDTLNDIKKVITNINKQLIDMEESVIKNTQAVEALRALIKSANNIATGM